MTLRNRFSQNGGGAEEGMAVEGGDEYMGGESFQAAVMRTASGDFLPPLT